MKLFRECLPGGEGLSSFLTYLPARAYLPTGPPPPDLARPEKVLFWQGVTWAACNLCFQKRRSRISKPVVSAATSDTILPERGGAHMKTH